MATGTIRRELVRFAVGGYAPQPGAVNVTPGAVTPIPFRRVGGRSSRRMAFFALRGYHIVEKRIIDANPCRETVGIVTRFALGGDIIRDMFRQPGRCIVLRVTVVAYRAVVDDRRAVVGQVTFVTGHVGVLADDVSRGLIVMPGNIRRDPDGGKIVDGGLFRFPSALPAAAGHGDDKDRNGYQTNEPRKIIHDSVTAIFIVIVQ